MKTFEKLQLVEEMTRLQLFARLQLFQKNYKMIAIDLSKQKAPVADLKSNTTN